jgi:type II secretory pathway component PulF
MRIRRRWSAYSRQSAVSEVLSKLALAAAEGASLTECLHLITRSPIRRIIHMPFAQIIALLALFSVFLVTISFPLMIAWLAIGPAALMIIVIRIACAQNRLLHRISLAESELAMLLREKMIGGLSLSQAMSDLHRVFSPAQIAVVRAGEESNQLQSALRTLAREAQVRQSAGVLNFYRHYPIIALFVCGALSMFIVWRIYPRLNDIYSQLGTSLPPEADFAFRLLTFQGFGGALGTSSVPMLFAVLMCLYADHIIRLHLGRIASAFACLLIVQAVVAPSLFRHSTTVWLGSVAVPVEWFGCGLLALIGLSMPLLCDLIRGAIALRSAQLARLLPWWRMRRCALERGSFFSALGLMLGRRVPAQEAIRIAAPTLGPAGLEKVAMRAAVRLENGESLSKVLVRTRLLRPRDEAHLSLSIAAGTVPDECARLGDELTREARDSIARMERVMRPLSILIVALLGFLVLIAIYLPLFRISLIAGAGN